MNKKVFRALGPQVVEKRFIGTEEAIPEGWHADQSAALAAYKDHANEVQPRRGRPRKAA